MEDFQDSRLRASDEDREKVAETLRENYAQGRLTLEEFDERTTSAYAAKTLGDLRSLTGDLPVPAVRPQPVPEAPPPRNPHQSMWWVPFVVLAIVGVAVVSLTSGHVHIWPLWIFVFLVFRGFGRGRPHNRP
ncbi:DUF1707 domain-containing protein [Nonomuraea sp. NPDC050536]|uniref:DUF1707 domain-containing protein n=1 Tax=Nonomuraea sp. NPDC050536 TaxID=3364366 RepID=UPI0037C69E08